MAEVFSNSESYWDNRFAGDWASCGGREQTRFFAEQALKHLPGWLARDIHNSKLTICDFGCAEGDAVELLAKTLGVPATGVDFSERAIALARSHFPERRFVRSSYTDIEEHDVLFTSNTLEHFDNPIAILRHLLRKTRKYAIVMTPFREAKRHEEHLHTFDFNSFPLKVDDFHVLSYDVIDTASVPGTIWPGQQILVIYGHREAARLGDQRLSLLAAERFDALATATGRIHQLESQVAAGTARARDLDARVATLGGQLDAAAAEREKMAAEREKMAAERAAAQRALGEALVSLDVVRRSRAEKVAEYLQALRQRPLVTMATTIRWMAGSYRSRGVGLVGALDADRILLQTRDRIAYAASIQGAAPAPTSAAAAPEPAASGTHVRSPGPDPHDAIELLKPIQVTVTAERFTDVTVTFTMITTVRNEARGLTDFLRSIEAQTCRPAELIVVDGGSSDATVSLVEEFARSTALRVVLVHGGEINIAAGRNLGLRRAANELVVFTDAGCRLDPGFCANMVGAFARYADADLVGGVYESMHAVGERYLLPDWNRTDWKAFLPSARSLAVRKSIALAIGGFPEFLTLTGEDTLFDVEYRRASRRWVFSRQARVLWDSPRTADEAFALAVRYGHGDGESGIGDHSLRGIVRELVRRYPYGGGLRDVADPVLRGLAVGYLEGRQRRGEIEARRRRVQGVVLLLSTRHVADPLCAERDAASSLVKRGLKVVFVNAHPAPHDTRVWLDLDPSLLELYSAGDFNWGEFLTRYGIMSERTFVLYPQYDPQLGSLVEKLKAKTGNAIEVFETAAELDQATRGLAAPRPAADSAALASPPRSADSAATAALVGSDSAVEVDPPASSWRKFWRTSRERGVAEALRRVRRKLASKAAPLFRRKQRRRRPLPRFGGAARRGHRYDLISFPIMPWSSRMQRSQHLLTRFAQHGTRVFRVDRGFVVGAETPSVREVHENVLQVTLSTARDMSIYTDTIDDASMDRMLEGLAQLRDAHEIRDAACIVELPFWYPLAKRLCDRFGWRLVYDCMDEHEGFATNVTEMVSREAQLARDADAVVVTSSYLLDKMTKYSDRCVLVRNGTDFDHFASPPRNDLLARISRPIIGYYGALSEWFDQELVEHVARTHPDWSIVLVGGNDAGTSFERLERLPNVHFLGEKPYAELPRYLYWFDVCMIPFRLTKLIQATNPVKFYEYISAGKPVVSVMLPELLAHREHAYLAANEHEFVDQIATALAEKDPALRRARVEVARENTWDGRHTAFRRVLDRLFGRASVVVVTYNNLELTKLCVDSLYAHTHPDAFELIIVDNASRDGTPAYLRSLEKRERNVKIVLNAENAGFAGANNQGIELARGEYVVLLNNDAVVTPGWLSKLVRHLDDRAVGMVGPATNMCGNESIVYVDYDTTTLDGFDDFVDRYYRWHATPDAFDIDMLSMFCVVIRADTMKEIGPLDTQFGIGMFEDTDYSQRLKASGYRLLSVRDAFVHHFGKSSFGKLPNAQYMKLYEENRGKFERKWALTSRY